MPEYSPYCPTLAGELAALWETVFGDPAVLVERFFALWQGDDFALTAVVDGHPVAAAYCLPGLEIRRPGTPPLPARYLYAVATHPAHRKQGLAAALCRTLRDACFARGELLLTKPAEESLYPWYEEKIGAVPVLPCRSMTVSTPTPGAIAPLLPEEYNARREALLADTPHVRLPDALFQWEHLLHSHYGGGLFAVADGIADVYAADGQMEVPELLSSAPERDVGALLSRFGVPAARIILPGGNAPYVSCAAPDTLPDGLDKVWFGPVFG